MSELDLYDAGAKLVADLIVDQYPDLVELELDGNIRPCWNQSSLACHMPEDILLFSDPCRAVQLTAINRAIWWMYADNRISDASAESLGAAIQASTELRTLHLDGEW